MAISKERLKELLKEGATIYTIKHNGGDVMELHLNKNTDDEFLYFLLGINEELFENKEEVEEKSKKIKWALKYHATRTEELDLPMWEEINKKHIGKEGDFRIVDKYNIELIYWKFKDSLIEVRYKKDGETIKQKDFKPATEENYIKACDLCLKLFKGEE